MENKIRNHSSYHNCVILDVLLLNWDTATECSLLIAFKKKAHLGVENYDIKIRLLTISGVC